MSRTTQEWQQLFEGTTCGPWLHNGRFRGVIQGRPEDTSPVTIICDTRIPYTAGPKYDEMRANMDLIAAAPDALAEVVRLRRELETLADWHDTKAMKARSYHAPGQEDEAERAARVHETARYKITRILNQIEGGA